MKLLKHLTVGILTLGILAAPWSALAADKTEKKDAKKTEKAKPYLLKTCAVTDEKLGEMGKPYLFTHEGRELQLCCKECLPDFKKNTAKIIKKVELAEQKLDKKSDKKADKKDKK